jgi:predicted  nucleic acid-binding Zn-ribbon protein
VKKQDEMEKIIKATAEIVDAKVKPYNLHPETLKLIVDKNVLIDELREQIVKQQEEIDDLLRQLVRAEKAMQFGRNHWRDK